MPGLRYKDPPKTSDSGTYRKNPPPLPLPHCWGLQARRASRLPRASAPPRPLALSSKAASRV